MSQPLQVRIQFANAEPVQAYWSGQLPLIIGRQEADESIFEISSKGDHEKLAACPREKIDISRRQIEVRYQGNDLYVRNLRPGMAMNIDSAKTPTDTDNGQKVSLPFLVKVGDCQVQFNHSLQTMSAPTGFYQDIPDQPLAKIKLPAAGDQTPGELIALLAQIVSVLQQKTTVSDLFTHACQAVARLLETDAVALYMVDQWDHPYGDNNVTPDESVLQQARSERRVVWGNANNNGNDDPGNASAFAIAAPVVILSDDQPTVSAIVYAERISKDGQTTGPFTELHAQLLELVTCTVAAAQVRIANQQTIGQFEQFFTPSLAKKLVNGGELLKASESEISVLICDVRNFSTISEHLSPTMISEWVQDVLSQLSEVVLECKGVVVDYVGDELIAMWGAPEHQPEHAEMACRCARKIMARMPSISDRWNEKIRHATHVGIGINTGQAFVGNTGSNIKFKYGPLGDTVNRAARVQGLTKYLKVDILITANTYKQLKDHDGIRRIGKARVVNIDEPIELFQVLADPTTAHNVHANYESALAKLESGDLAEAGKLIKNIIDFDSPDHPTLLMFDEIIRRAISGQSSGKYEWTFDRK